MSQPTRSREFCGRALEQPEKLWAEEAEATNTGGWRIVEKYRATIIFTSLAAIRALKRQDSEISPQI
jgi:hypothetical protein